MKYSLCAHYCFNFFLDSEKNSDDQSDTQKQTRTFFVAVDAFFIHILKFWKVEGGKADMQH